MWLMLAFLALPLIEIALFVVLGGAIGLWLTLAWVVLAVVFGVLILKKVARLGPISFQRDVQTLRDPTSPVAQRALTVLAAVLLIVPGFFTDAAGLLLLLLPVQTLIIGHFAGRGGQGSAARSASMTIDGEWSEVSPPADNWKSDTPEPPSGPTRH
jgi:UPF0716 protein FxsA